MESDQQRAGLNIDAALDAPVYQQIAAQIGDAIARGEHLPGERLPAIRTLAAELGLHRDTVALAYEQLANAGWVEARVGAGTFVRSPRVASARAATSDSTVGAPASILPRRESEIDLTLAPQVERLIALDNTRPRYATGDDMVALHRLIPDPRFYPVDEFRECVNSAIREEGAELFSYAPPEGDPGRRRR